MNTLSGGVAGNHLEQADRHTPIGEDLDLAARALRRGLLAEHAAHGIGRTPEKRNPASGGVLGRARSPEGSVEFFA